MKHLLWTLTVALLLQLAATHHAHAQLHDRQMRLHYYGLLRKDPLRALGWDALLPGAGSVYNGLYVNAAVTFTLSAAGAVVWGIGAARDDSRLIWAGAGTFAGGRAYGLLSAPLGSVLLNAAFRRQLGLNLRF
jgi:hypothetical protein